MRPFNIEEAKAGKAVVTADGSSVRIICFDRVHEGSWPICGLVYTKSYQEAFVSCTAEGIAAGHDPTKNLYMAVEKKEGWVVLFKDKLFTDIPEVTSIFPCEKSATAYKERWNCLAVVKIEWEE